MALEHRQEALSVGRIARLDNQVEDQANDGPITDYEAGESWLEPPGAAIR